MDGLSTARHSSYPLGTASQWTGRAHQVVANDNHFCRICTPGSLVSVRNEWGLNLRKSVRAAMGLLISRGWYQGCRRQYYALAIYALAVCFVLRLLRRIQLTDDEECQLAAAAAVAKWKSGERWRAEHVSGWQQSAAWHLKWFHCSVDRIR